jgi:broad specificity phosphatase PhoE
MQTTVFLVRHGVTEWHQARKVLGHRDIGLNDRGVGQARAVAEALGATKITEIISSPLARATQTAEIVAEKFHVPVARDPRLADFRVGKWEGMGYDEVAASVEYQKFLADPMSQRIPGGEDLRDIRDRAVGAVEQSLGDAPTGESLAIVTHAGIVRVVLAHYLGMNLAHYHLLRVAPGSISALVFGDDREMPRVLAVNWNVTLGDL